MFLVSNSRFGDGPMRGSLSLILLSIAVVVLMPASDDPDSTGSWRSIGNTLLVAAFQTPLHTTPASKPPKSHLCSPSSRIATGTKVFSTVGIGRHPCNDKSPSAAQSSRTKLHMSSNVKKRKYVDNSDAFFEPNSTVPSAADLATAAREGGFILPSPGILDFAEEREREEAAPSVMASAAASLDQHQLQDRASTVVSAPMREDETTSSSPTSPGVRKILKFAIPAIGVWLCGPILSLIDTSAVGLLAGTAHQAALSPAVAVTEYTALLMAFMYTATTSLVAGAKQKDKDDPTKPKTAKTLVTSMKLAGFVGVALGATLLALSRVMLRSIIGNDSIDPVVFGTALKYIRIRALGFPAAAVIGSAQAACLGMQDVRTPLFVLAAAAVVNFFGDVMFVGSKHAWIGGASGAAWATVFSQYAAFAMFLKWLMSRPSAKARKLNRGAAIKEATGEKPSTRKDDATPAVISLSNAILEQTSSPVNGHPSQRRSKPLMQSSSNTRVGRDPKRVLFSTAAKLRSLTFEARLKELRAKKASKESMSSSTTEQRFSSRGFLQGRFRKRELFTLPDRVAALEFWPYVFPVTTTSVGRVSSYVAMSHVVSSCFGTMAMAAQQVIMSIFYCLCPVADALNLTAQSFVPAIFEGEKSKERAEMLRKSGRNFLKAGLIFGAFLVGVVACIPLFSKFLTTDPVVISQVNAVVPLLAISFAVHGGLCALEGVLLGQKDLGFLGKSYALYFAAVPWFMLRVKKAVLSGAAGADLTSVWKVFASYQLVRFSMFVGRVGQLARRRIREVAEPSTVIIKVIDDIGIDKMGKSLNEVDGVSDTPLVSSKDIIADPLQ